jgi:hypothetical protein
MNNDEKPGTCPAKETESTNPIRNACWLQSLLPPCPFERFKTWNKEQNDTTPKTSDHADQTKTSTSNIINLDSVRLPATTVTGGSIFGMKPSFNCERKKWREQQKRQRCMMERFCEKRREQEDIEWECNQNQQQQQHTNRNDDQDISQSCSNKRLCRQQTPQQQNNSQCTFFKAPCTQSFFSQSTTSTSSMSSSSLFSQSASSVFFNSTDNAKKQNLQTSFGTSRTTTPAFNDSQQHGDSCKRES